MATETAARVNSPVDTMAAEVIAAMWCLPVSVALILEGRLQLGLSRMAIGAETGLMAHGADRFVLVGGLAVIAAPG